MMGKNWGGWANWPPNMVARFRQACLMLKADNLFHALVPIRSARYRPCCDQISDLFIRENPGLRTPTEGIIQRNLKI